MSDKIALSLSEAAQTLGVSYGSLLKAVHAGFLPARRIGDRWLVSRTGLQAWLDKNERAADCQ